MIVTLTAHPSLDRTITLGAPLFPGEVQAAVSSREDAGGKGINVSRVVRAAGEPGIAVLPLATDDPFEAALHASDLDARRVPVHGHVRANLTITDPAGVTTKLNLPGAALTADDVSAIIDTVVAASRDARWLVLAGSLPPGAPDDFYVRVITRVREAHGVAAPLIAVDTSGPALAAVVEHGKPDLIKPNDDELAELTGAEIAGTEPSGSNLAATNPTAEPADPATNPTAEPRDLPQSVLDIARTLVPSRVGAALITLGSHGAVLVDAEGAWSAAPPPIRVVSTVGAGDSSLAGYVLAHVRGADAAERLRSAIRYGAAAASLPGTKAPTPADLPPGDVPVTQLA